MTENINTVCPRKKSTKLCRMIVVKLRNTWSKIFTFNRIISDWPWLLFHKLPTEDSGLATHLGPPPPGSYATASWFNKPVSFILFTPLKCDWRLREVGRLFTFNYFFFHNRGIVLKSLYWIRSSILQCANGFVFLILEKYLHGLSDYLNCRKGGYHRQTGHVTYAENKMDGSEGNSIFRELVWPNWLSSL